MNEEIEYAEMLEIPISTVNIVRKPRKHKKGERTLLSASQHEETDVLQNTVIANVNEKVSNLTEEASNENTAPVEEDGEDGSIDFDSIPERIDTVRLYSDNGKNDGLYPTDYTLNDRGRYGLKEQPKAIRIALGVEFGLACALCGAIFLTNVFVPGSAINTFFRALNTPTENTAKPYTDFTLSAVVSEFSDAELNLSPTGVLSFVDDCHIYPVADGKIGEIAKGEDDLYTVKVFYSDSFTGVFSGLNNVYYSEGDTVKTNVPIGYTTGEEEVQVTMYSNGILLNCFEVTEENCLAWISADENV